MSTDAGSVRVSIFNQSYSLRSANGDGEHVRRVAQLVDERMRAVASGLAVHDVAKVAVLTALNLADELEGLRSFYESELREMLARARAEEEASADAPPAHDTEPAALDEPRSFSEPQSVEESRSFDEPRSFEESRPASADARASYSAPTRGGAEGSTARDEQSWFEAIFDTDAPPPRAGDERLSSRISSRLRRLRQSSPGNSITEGGGEES